MTTLRSLRDADERCGGKAARLGVLLREGFAVPRGFVITDPRGEGWTHRLTDALAHLGPGPYAVRSSALTEDGGNASFAGQLHTTLNVQSATSVVDAVARTTASRDAFRATVYASRLGLPTVTGPQPVLVQQMVAPESAGLLFTRHPVTGAKQFVIEATSGLGDALAAGTVTPERWTVEDETAAPEAGVDSAVLTADSALNLAVLGQQIESVFLAPQDVEWAVADGRTWILQARPITAADALQRPNEMNPASGNVLAAGVPASPGVALGEVTVITSLDDFDAFDAGDVLVCHSTSPAWTPLLARAAAVVTETGGLLAHAAIVAREFGIPAVVAAEGAMKLLAGTTRSVVVDGGRGIVTAHTTGAHQ